MIKLRSYLNLPNLYPQVVSYLGTTTKGFMPIPGQASLFIEIEPGMAINMLMDKILKNTLVIPGLMIIERAYGLLEVHHDKQSEIEQAGNIVLDYLNLDINNRMKPKIISKQIINSVHPYHSQLLNKIRFGAMIAPGESLFILETEPAGYVLLAANEAEKAADVKLVEMRCYGAYGRLYISGNEAMIDAASDAALTALQNIDGINNNK